MPAPAAGSSAHARTSRSSRRSIIAGSSSPRRSSSASAPRAGAGGRHRGAGSACGSAASAGADRWNRAGVAQGAANGGPGPGSGPGWARIKSGSGVRRHLRRAPTRSLTAPEVFAQRMYRVGAAGGCVASTKGSSLRPRQPNPGPPGFGLFLRAHDDGGGRSAQVTSAYGGCGGELTPSWSASPGS
jgi:hypothetical protein